MLQHIITINLYEYVTNCLSAGCNVIIYFVFFFNQPNGDAQELLSLRQGPVKVFSIIYRVNASEPEHLGS